MTIDVGIIEWVEDTEPIKAVVESELGRAVGAGRSVHTSALRAQQYRQKWLEKRGGNGKTVESESGCAVACLLLPCQRCVTLVYVQKLQVAPLATRTCTKSLVWTARQWPCTITSSTWCHATCFAIASSPWLLVLRPSLCCATRCVCWLALCTVCYCC